MHDSNISRSEANYGKRMVKTGGVSTRGGKHKQDSFYNLNTSGRHWNDIDLLFSFCH